MEHVLIADDHEVTRRGIRELLRDAYEGVQVAEAVDAATALALLPKNAWDLVLLDIFMPGSNVLDLIRSIRAVEPEVPILILTALTEPEYVIQTLEAGANGLIHKHRAADELLEAIGRVAGGGTYLHAESASALAASLRAPKTLLPHESLSPRELEIMIAIAQGLAIKEIAANLDLSDKTVATYLSRIREKTGLMSHVDIARYALKHSLVD